MRYWTWPKRLRLKRKMPKVRPAHRKRRAFFLSLDGEDDREHRETLDLPTEGTLEAVEINAAFRRRAKSAHPDAGGSDEHYRRIAEARDALLKQAAGAL